MTTLLRTTKRETLSEVRERGKMRAIIVELRPTFVVVRLKGLPSSRYTVTYAQMFNAGAKNAADQVRRERAEAKKAKGKAA